MQTMMSSLNQHINDHTQDGCREMVNVLGFAEMPMGYALMRNGDDTHYYWLKHDGNEGPICVKRWMAYRFAQANAAQETTP